MAYIIGNYNKYDSWDRAHSHYLFTINGQVYAIKEVELEWGLPLLPGLEEAPETYHLYDTYEEAAAYAYHMKQLNY